MEDGHHTLRSPDGEGNIGRTLEEARMDRGLSLKEATRATGIRERYLLGLERDDYTVLPDAVYARAFLKTYANFLGLDGDSISRGLRTRQKPLHKRSITHETPGDRPGERYPGSKFSGFAVATAFIVAFVIAALIGALYYVGLTVLDEPSRAGQQNAPDRGREPGPDGGRPVSDAAPLGTLEVAVTVKGEPVWVQVSSDSETVFEEIAEPGFSRTFKARREVVIRAGYTAPISVKVNGQNVEPLGEPGEILDRSFTLKSAG